ncbi:MAG: DOPA 4,5-dioxygenase family protein [Alphaproteobacteria bacterium]|nr:DOPA 4,5-dioxygenase family protein [Alphaproteobacteria bacterium]
MTTPDSAAIPAWHAHIYYDPETTKDRAQALREKIAAQFPDAIIGRWHDELVGPHTRSMYQVAFGHALFDRLVPFLAVNRAGLAILVHADSTGDHAADHTDHAIWMGEVLDVNTTQWR